ncbi:EamA family transporter RarD [Cohnella sp. CFH 77786]|uniref:EamA family transporter RarD n=1 Tax=Cohnella sp. CFH 77786 TaxID=2662265 RepID=UPI001C60F454|nr:EamA family transporter RarD [Cohnella sp. CFH 77786]MBW5444520.1 EamA family transporter RarD [Cohnella sp. CFH 77786]
MRTGLFYAVLAYVAWGVFPLYWKAFETLPANEILAHRVVWSFVFVLVLWIWQRRIGDFFRLFRTSRTAALLGVSSLLISANWLIFIWAVIHGHVKETSLGYYITPLFNVVLGVLFLGEKPNRGQWAAVAMAGIAVLLAAVDYGRVPWISLSLAVTFGFYGLAKKRAGYDATAGLLGETAFVLPVAAAYLVYLTGQRLDSAWDLPAGHFVLLLLSGAVTALPLLWFAKAASRLPLSTLGFVQYIGPTIQFALSAFVFHEAFSPLLILVFMLIWVAIAVYMSSSYRPAAKPARAG